MLCGFVIRWITSTNIAITEPRYMRLISVLKQVSMSTRTEFHMSLL